MQQFTTSSPQFHLLIHQKKKKINFLPNPQIQSRTRKNTDTQKNILKFCPTTLPENITKRVALTSNLLQNLPNQDSNFKTTAKLASNLKQGRTFHELVSSKLNPSPDPQIQSSNCSPEAEEPKGEARNPRDPERGGDSRSQWARRGGSGGEREATIHVRAKANIGGERNARN